MKFIVERMALERMIRHLHAERGVAGPRQRMMQLSACAARVFVEANGVAAGIEALVLDDGTCKVPRMRFLKILRTFAHKQNLTLAAEGDGLRIESFVMNATCFSPVATPPGTFQVFPVTDAWLVPAPPATPKPAPPESRWLNTRWWE